MPAALVLVALTALAERLDLVVGRRTRVSLAGPFLVAAALVGGPLVGACAGASTEAFTTGDPWRKRALCAAAGALQGLAIGLVGQQFSHDGVSGAVVGGGRRLADRLRAEREGRCCAHSVPASGCARSYVPPGARSSSPGSCLRRCSSSSSTSSRRRRGSRSRSPPACCSSPPGRTGSAAASS